MQVDLSGMLHRRQDHFSSPAINLQAVFLIWWWYMIYALYISSVRSQTVLVLPYFLNNKYIKCCTAYGTGGCSTQDHQGCGKLPSFLSQWVIKISIVRLYYFKASPLPLLYHPRHSFSLYSPIIDPLFPSFARRLCLRSSNKKKHNLPRY